MSEVKAILPNRKRSKTPMRFCSRSGPDKSMSFNDVSRNFAVQSKTTLTLPDFKGGLRDGEVKPHSFSVFVGDQTSMTFGQVPVNSFYVFCL